MRVEVTKHNNVKHDEVLHVAGSVFEADDESAKALIEAGAVVALPEEEAEEVAEATEEPAEASEEAVATETAPEVEKPAEAAKEAPKNTAAPKKKATSKK